MHYTVAEGGKERKVIHQQAKTTFDSPPLDTTKYDTRAHPQLFFPTRKRFRGEVSPVPKWLTISVSPHHYCNQLATRKLLPGALHSKIKQPRFPNRIPINKYVTYSFRLVFSQMPVDNQCFHNLVCCFCRRNIP